MPEVTVRDAQRGDAAVISEIGSAATPYVVRSAGRASADMREDRTLRRRRWMGLAGGVVAGTATAQLITEHEVLVGVEVHPTQGSRGVGTALLATAIRAFPEAVALRARGNADPISMAFAVRNGFLPDRRDEIGRVDPRDVDLPAEDPPGAHLRLLTLEALPDLRMLLETYNLCVARNDAGIAQRFTMYQMRTQWWDDPDHAPSLSFGVVDDGGPRPVLASFTSVQVDEERGRAWTGITGTHPDYRRRGLALLVKRRMLTALAAAGVREAWAYHDPSDPQTFEMNERLGYVSAAASLRLTRRLPG